VTGPVGGPVGGPAGKEGWLAELLSQFGQTGSYLTIEDPYMLGDPDAGLHVGYKLTDDRQTVALVVRVERGSPLHEQIRRVAASDLGGRLHLELSPAGARRTAGRLAVRADECDPDAAGPLAVLADGALEGILRGIVVSALPDSMPTPQAHRTAALIAELVAALARATTRTP
jgi:hypothetical protein